MITHRRANPGKKVAAVLLLMASLLLASCGEGGSGGTAIAAATVSGGSCNYTATGNCMEYTGAAWKGMTMQRLCESQKGVFLTGACPAEGRLGMCLKAKGSKDESRLGYYANFPGYGVKLTPAAVATEGAEQCTKSLKGEWLAKP
jgi:hypothetical protein